MERKFTKGPWNVVDCAFICDDKEIVVASVRNWETEESCENANLIAAAPELYESLDLLLSIVINEGWSDTMVKNAESVLARVRVEEK